MNYSSQEYVWICCCSWCARPPKRKGSFVKRFEEKKSFLEPLFWRGYWWSSPQAQTWDSWRHTQRTQKHKGSGSVKREYDSQKTFKLPFTDQLSDFRLATLCVCVQDKLQPRSSLQEIKSENKTYRLCLLCFVTWPPMMRNCQNFQPPVCTSDIGEEALLHVIGRQLGHKWLHWEQHPIQQLCLLFLLVQCVST